MDRLRETDCDAARTIPFFIIHRDVIKGQCNVIKGHSFSFVGTSSVTIFYKHTVYVYLYVYHTNMNVAGRETETKRERYRAGVNIVPDQLGLTWRCERKKEEGKNESGRGTEKKKEGGEGNRGEKSAKQISAAASVVHTQIIMQGVEQLTNSNDTGKKKISAVICSLKPSKSVWGQHECTDSKDATYSHVAMSWLHHCSQLLHL